MILKSINKKQVAFGWIAIILFLGMVAFQAKAAFLASLNDTLSDHTASAASNHTIAFTTSSGAAEGRTIAVTFASSFDTSTISASDIDLAVGAVDRTLAVNCSGAEQISASIASDILIFTVCAGDGGAIPTSSTVTIQIGTNATSQIAGSNRIINPSSAGSYTITTGGTFGDRGAIAVAIQSSGSVAIGGTVSGGATGSGPAPGGGGLGGGDRAAPAISAISVGSITQTSATVSWTTNEISTSYVDYGLTVSYEAGTAGNPGLVTGHLVSLTGLTSGTTYHFRVHSADNSGNEASSTDLTFTTLSPPDTTLPVISNVQVLSITGTGATIGWTTNESATSAVDYGPTTSYATGTVSDGALVLDHSLIITGLASETFYHFHVRSSDGSGNASVSSDYTFTTLDVMPPVISGLSVTDITQTSARVVWTTNESANSAVDYGPTTSYGFGAVSSAAFVASHSISLTGLTANIIYHIRARSADTAGNSRESSDFTFTTLPDTTAPSNVSGFSAREFLAGNVRLTWANPMDADFAGVRIIRRSDRFPTGPTDGTNIFEGLATEFLDTGLAGLINYRYGAFARDTSNNFASGALTQITTSAPTPPPIPSVCGNGFCESDETSTSCVADCAVLPTRGLVCGNSVCEYGETPTSCPSDCHVSPPVILCGNGTCDTGETSDSCLIDCPAVPATPSVCGNYICDVGETTETCPTDCPVIEVPPTTVGAPERLSLSDLHLLVGAGRIELQPIYSKYEVLSGRPLAVSIEVSSFARDPEEVRLVLGESAYLLVRSDGEYTTSIMTPSPRESVPMILSVLYPDGSSDRLDALVDARSEGRALTQLANGERVGIEGALITLFDTRDSVWSAGAFGQENPTLANAGGRFSFYVPNGSYVLRVRKDGFREEQISLNVLRNIVSGEIVLIRLPLPIVETVGNIITAPISAQEKILEVGNLIGNVVDYGLEVTQREVIDNPRVEEAAENIAAPTLAVVATASAGAAASTVGIANLLRFLFTQPAVFLARRKRRSWGVVYNAITKIPIGLATVRLYNVDAGKLLQTRVTDPVGRYFFIVKQGFYKIEVQKSGFSFPTSYLAGKKSDPLFLDVYHGEHVEVEERDTTIAANIPIDPEVKEKAPARILRTILLRRIEHAIAIISPIVAGATVVISPTPLTIGLFAGQVVLYVLIQVLIKPKKPKGWGIVYDARTRRPIERAIVRIFEPIYGKLLDMQVTDSQGRYSFLVGPNFYKVASVKEGYAPAEVSIDYSGKKEADVVKEDINLHPSEEKSEWKEEPV